MALGAFASSGCRLSHGLGGGGAVTVLSVVGDVIITYIPAARATVSSRDISDVCVGRPLLNGVSELHGKTDAARSRHLGATHLGSLAPS